METPTVAEEEEKIQNFAKEWSRTIKTSQYAPQIFTGLNQMDLLESRRETLWRNYTVTQIKKKLFDPILCHFDKL